MELKALVRDLYSVDRPQGCTDEEIAAMKERFGALPAVVEDFWRTFGHTEELNRCQDTWWFPALYEKWEDLSEGDFLVLLCENQGVCRSGIRKTDLSLPDPPVYTRMDEGDPWELSAPTASEFLEAALTYEAVWRLEYIPEDCFFYWLTGEELDTVQTKLTKRPVTLRNWMEYEITFYSSRPDNLVVIMDVGGGYQAMYGAATRESYDALMEVMEGLGEEI